MQMFLEAVVVWNSELHWSCSMVLSHILIWGKLIELWTKNMVQLFLRQRARQGWWDGFLSVNQNHPATVTGSSKSNRLFKFVATRTAFLSPCVLCVNLNWRHSSARRYPWITFTLLPRPCCDKLQLLLKLLLTTFLAIFQQKWQQ